MSQLTPEQTQQAIAEAPRGTMAVLLAYAILMAAAWCAMFFGFFLPHGAVH